MTILFSYLDLPPVPEFLLEKCLKNIDLIDRNPQLNELNKLEGIGHNITFLPSEFLIWYNLKIIRPLFLNNIPDEAKKATLHVSHYIKDINFRNQNPLGNGTHPIHYDYGRKWAINYIITTGGDKVITTWYNDEKETILHKQEIEPFRWHIIKVKPTLHGVEGIRPGLLRTIISGNFSPEDDNFNIKDKFKHLMINE